MECGYGCPITFQGDQRLLAFFDLPHSHRSSAAMSSSRPRCSDACTLRRTLSSLSYPCIVNGGACSWRSEEIDPRIVHLGKLQHCSAPDGMHLAKNQRHSANAVGANALHSLGLTGNLLQIQPNGSAIPTRFIAYSTLRLVIRDVHKNLSSVPSIVTALASSAPTLENKSKPMVCN